MYEGYSSRTAKNDLLLIELDKDIIFSERVMPICLPHHLVNHNFEYEDVIVLGESESGDDSMRVFSSTYMTENKTSSYCVRMWVPNNQGVTAVVK